MYPLSVRFMGPRPGHCALAMISSWFPSVSPAAQEHPPGVEERPPQMLQPWRRCGQVPPPARLPANCSAQTLSVPLLARSCPASSGISVSLCICDLTLAVILSPDLTTAFAFYALQCHLPQSLRLKTLKTSLAVKMTQGVKAFAAEPL